MFFSSKNSPRPPMVAVLLAGLFVFLASPAQAQIGNDASQDTTTLRFFAEVNGGAAFYGHFLEQQARYGIDGTYGERELTARTGLSLGLAVGARLFERNAVRLAVNYQPSQFEYQDDTGRGVDVLDSGSLADVDLFTVSGEAERTFFRLGPVAPYASVGLSMGVWSLGDGGAVTAGDSETVVRWGTTSGLGTRVLLTPNFSLNIEANANSMGNPFDGNDAFQAVDDSDRPLPPFEEPTSVRVLRVRGGLRYLF